MEIGTVVVLVVVAAAVAVATVAAVADAISDRDLPIVFVHRILLPDVRKSLVMRLCFD
jgi:hypothetical protein